jgi:hypothetical protein
MSPSSSIALRCPLVLLAKTCQTGSSLTLLLALLVDFLPSSDSGSCCKVLRYGPFDWLRVIMCSTKIPSRLNELNKLFGDSLLKYGWSAWAKALKKRILLLRLKCLVTLISSGVSMILFVRIMA